MISYNIGVSTFNLQKYKIIFSYKDYIVSIPKI